MMTNKIVFIDTEVSIKEKKVCDIGAIKDENTVLHSASVDKFYHFIGDAKFICGHSKARPQSRSAVRPHKRRHRDGTVGRCAPSTRRRPDNPPLPAGEDNCCPPPRVHRPGWCRT